MTTTIPALDEERVSAHFDAEKGISFITYRGVLDATTTRQMYAWVGDLLNVIGPDATRGVVIDFREVKRFTRDNLYTTRRQSSDINESTDNSGHPVALIVANYYQDQMVRVSMMATPGERRKRVVNTRDEALSFINNWQAKAE